jgi:carboxypeptidase C (cathepsin A)
MYINQNSWNKKANIIYLEAPAGVGFTYASESAKTTNDTQTAVDNLMALRVFFEQYPTYQGNDFYLAGESYAGIYVPMLAEEILNYNAGH